MRHHLTPWSRRGFIARMASVAAVLLAGCAAPPQATNVSKELSFDEAVAEATDGLAGQTQRLPAFLAKVESKLVKKGVVLDPMIDANSGEQTAVTQKLERGVTGRLTERFPQFELLAFQAANLAKAQYLLTGTATRSQASGHAVFRIDLALTELKTGNVVAQATALASGNGLDDTPLPYYRDSPVLVKDKVVEGYIRTSATPPGQHGDAYYLERVAAATLITQATDSYNAERYQDALGEYRSALATPAGQQLRVLSGIYLTNAKLGRSAEAEQAFGRLVALGIESNKLGVKFLFNPGSTDFWPDPRINGPYPMWLRQIAHVASASKACMDVVGHTSHTGSAQANDVLSLQRAEAIRQKLTTESSDLAPRMKAIGKGFRENIVGSGTDNAVDALDRRVEFKIVPCG